MTPAQQPIVFWVFVGFFVVLGIVALLAIVGVIKTEPRFRTFAVVTFAASVISVVVVWAKSQPVLDIFVNLEPPSSVVPDSFELVSGTYEYFERSDSEKSKSLSGPAELTAGMQPGWWTAKIPFPGTATSVRLIFKEKSGKHWEVRSFYPNYSRQTLAPYELARGESPKPPVALELVSSALAAEGALRFTNYAKVSGSSQGRTYYKWRLFVDEPNQVLDKIEEVRYLLHPSFPDPLKVQKNANEKFALDATGWGSFNVQITVKYKNRKSEQTSYFVDLSKAWPAHVQ